MSIFLESMICFLIEVISFVLCFLLIKKMKLKHKYSLFLFFAVAIVGQVVWKGVFHRSSNLTLVMGLLFPFFCKNKNRKGFYVFFILVALIESLSYGFSVYLVALFKGYKLEGITGSGEHIFCLLLFPSCVCLYYIVQKFLCNAKIGLFYYKEQKIILSVVLICSISCMLMHVRIAVGNGNIKQRLFVSSSMFVIIIIIYLITTVWQGQVMWKNQQLQHEQTMYDYLTKSQQQYLDYIIKRDDDIRKFRHDIRAHMIIMRSMAERNDMDGLLAYINEVDDLTQKKQAQQFTGNSTIDAIINDLHTRMEQGNIEFGVNGHIHIEGDEKIFDISICMYNILLNAIEALEKLESKDKLIKLDISQYQKKLYFKISNNCMIKENCEDITALDTDKEDKLNHGIGSKNVAEIVERNNGKLLYSVKNGLFITELLI